MTNEAPAKGPDEGPDHHEMISLTSDIVAAYVGNNAVATSDLPGLIETVYGTLSKVGAAAEPEAAQEPAVPVKRSVKRDSIVCLECGSAQKMLKRHLATAHDMTPQDYRAKWNLAGDYPMVAPAYADKRRELAKKIGLGRKPAAAKPAPKRKSGNQKKAS